MNEKYLLIDADEVIFDWLTPFHEYAQHKLKRTIEGRPVLFALHHWLGTSEQNTKQLVHDFNTHNPAFENLKPAFNADTYLPLIYNKGYRIAIISACGNSDTIIKKRINNIEKHFSNIIHDIHCVGSSAEKSDILKKYSPSIWVEDRYENAKEGQKHNHTSVIIRQPHNIQYEPIDQSIKWVNDWKELFDFV